MFIGIALCGRLSCLEPAAYFTDGQSRGNSKNTEASVIFFSSDLKTLVVFSEVLFFGNLLTKREYLDVTVLSKRHSVNVLVRSSHLV